MGFYSDHDGQFTIYDAPKGGGTTVRAWITFRKTGALQLKGDEVYYHGNKLHAQVVRDAGYQLDWFQEVPGESVCIKRDPIERFISCYEDKILKTKKFKHTPIDQILDEFEDFFHRNDAPHGSNPEVGFLWYHFAPQTRHLGPSTAYYTHVFDLSDLDTRVRAYLSDRWGVALPPLHCRKSPDKVTQLTSNQIAKLKRLYQEDYDCGWY